MKISLTKIFTDTVFLAFVSFIITFAVANYFVKRPYSLLVALWAAFFFGILGNCVIVFFEKKRVKKEKEKREKAALLDSVTFAKDEEKEKVFLSALKKDYPSVKLSRGGYFIPEKNVLVFIEAGYSPLDKAKTVKIFNLLSKDEKAALYYRFKESGADEFAERFNGKIILKSENDLISLIEKSDVKLSPPFLTFPEKRKVAFKETMKKKKAVKYLLLGLTFLGLSFILPLKLYYIIFGGVLCLFSLVTFFFGYSEKEKSVS